MPRFEVTPSPNQGERREGPVDLLLLHYTGMSTAEAAHAWLCDPASQVSSHYFIYEDGRICQLVPEDKRAWHAGIAFWDGSRDINSRSVGIEIANPGHEGGLPAFPPAQMEAVAALGVDICARLAIPAQRVLAHSDVAPARKRDPGEAFDWGWLAARGVGHWVEPAPVTGGRFFQRGDSGQPVEALQAMLALYGYDVEVSGDYDTVTEQVVTAFQRHFRPAKVDGIADASTIETLHRLHTNLVNCG